MAISRDNHEQRSKNHCVCDSSGNFLRDTLLGEFIAWPPINIHVVRIFWGRGWQNTKLLLAKNNSGNIGARI